MHARTATRQFFAAAAVFTLMQQPSLAQDVYVYPAQGQSDEQLSQDRYQCHSWAVSESGFDPSQFSQLEPVRTVRVPVGRNAAEGAAAKGTIAGAVTGGIIGSHGGNVGEGAVIGAVLGTLAGSAIENQGQRQAREAAEAQAQREAQLIAQSESELALRKSNYRRALTACLEGRGYTVR